MNKKYLYILVGVISILLGIFCVIDKRLPAVLCGIGLILYGVGGFVHWRERRKAGAAGAWVMTGMLLAIAFGIFILLGDQIGQFAARFLLISLSIWLMAEGVLEFLGAIMYRKAMTSADLGVQAPGSVSSMVLGTIMIAVGMIGIISPVFAEYTIWIWIVGELILSGVRLIWLARSAGVLEESDR